MRTIRPAETEKCLLCGREFDKMYMEEVFFGRKRYICLECKRIGNKQVDARKAACRSAIRDHKE